MTTGMKVALAGMGLSFLLLIMRKVFMKASSLYDNSSAALKRAIECGAEADEVRRKTQEKNKALLTEIISIATCFVLAAGDIYALIVMIRLIMRHFGA